MITAENEWLEFLKQKPQWAGPQEKTIFLVPHPDDETLGAGGLIVDLRKKNNEVVIIAITDGENANPKIKNLSQIRQDEQEKALQLLGVNKNNIIRLKLVDSSIQHSEEKLEQLLLPLINKNDHIMAPWIEDYHSDHKAVGRIALKIAQQTKSFLTFYFFWTWHHSGINDLFSYPLHLYSLKKETFELKQNALNFYVSQYSKKYGEPILSKDFLVPTLRNFEVYFPYG